jgi:hypothetical protein
MALESDIEIIQCECTQWQWIQHEESFVHTFDNDMTINSIVDIDQFSFAHFPSRPNTNHIIDKTN